MSDATEVIQPIVKQKIKSNSVKISAKCSTCHRRLHLMSPGSVPVCKNGHAITEPLVYRTPKGTQSTKPRAARTTK